MATVIADKVMQCTEEEDPELWDNGSPLSHVHADAPPMYVIQGTHDTLVWVEEAQTFVSALEVLAAAKPNHGVGRISGGRRIAVLGDMLELGAEEAALHAGIAALPITNDIALFHCVGPRMRHLYEALPLHQRGAWAETAGELAENAGSLVDAGDVVLVKGSKSSHVSLIVDAIRKLGHAPAIQEG